MMKKWKMGHKILVDLCVALQGAVEQHEGHLVQVVHLHRLGVDGPKPGANYGRPSHTNLMRNTQRPFLSKPARGKKMPAWRMCCRLAWRAGGSQEGDGVSGGGQPGTWVGSQPENQLGKLDLTEK